jgi:hypothetical protein
MPRKKRIDQFHWHEALDRSLLAFEFFDQYVRQHSAVQASKKLKRETAEIADRMFRLYQALGEKSLNGDRDA